MPVQKTLLVPCSVSLFQTWSLIIQMLWVFAVNFSYLLLSLANYVISSQPIRASSLLVLPKLSLTNVIKICPHFPQRGTTLYCDLCYMASCMNQEKFRCYLWPNPYFSKKVIFHLLFFFLKNIPLINHMHMNPYLMLASRESNPRSLVPGKVLRSKW